MMYLNRTYPQLTFQMKNQDGYNSIYITADPEVNKLTLAIATNTENTKFSPGELVPESQAENATGSILYLDLSELNLSDSEIDGLLFSADGWRFKVYKEDKQVCMTPTREAMLGPESKKPIEMQIMNLVLSKPPGVSSVKLVVDYYHVGNISEMDISSFKVGLQNPPGKDGNLHEALSIDASKHEIISNNDECKDLRPNAIDLVFRPGSIPREIIAGTDTSFVLTFVYARGKPGFGALTNPDNASRINVGKGTNASSWEINPGTNMQDPSWELKPPAGEKILDLDSLCVLDFYIKNIKTDFEPGPTLMLVTYTGVPNFGDGVYSIPLEKVAHVNIKSLTVTPNPAVLENGTSKVKIAWDARDAISLTLIPFYQEVTELDSFDAYLKKSSSITMIAVGDGQGNMDYKTVEAEILPVINSFYASPISIYYKDFPHDVNLSWKVASNEDVELISSVKKGSKFLPSSYIMSEPIEKPQMLTLNSESKNDSIGMKRSVIIQAFKVESGYAGTSANPISKPVSVSTAPMAQFVAAVNGKDNTVSIINTLKLDLYARPIAVGLEPVDVLFSNDGKYLYVANRNDESITVIAVSYNNSLDKYDFILHSSIQLKSRPQRICISPDDRYIFVSSISKDDGAGKLVVLERGEDDGLQVKQTINIGKNPAGLTVSPCGVKVFVANSGDDTVSVIGYNPYDECFSQSPKIEELCSEPVDVALAGPNSSVLLIVCRGSNSVIAVNSDGWDYSHRKKLVVGNSPYGICITPDRSYAFISNSGSNSLTLVGCNGGVECCTVLEKSIDAGSQPMGLAASTDGSMVFAANGGGNNLTVLNLINYRETGDPIELGTGSALTGLAASPNAKTVVAWHNFLVNFGKTPPEDIPKGLYIVDLPSGTVSRKMTDKKIIRCIYYPNEETKKAFAIALDESLIYVIETKRFSNLQIPIEKSPDGESRFPLDLCISKDGKTIYAVVRDGKGRHRLLVFDCNILENEYNIRSDIELFTSDWGSNLVLAECSPDGSHVFVLSATDMKIWTAARGESGSYTTCPTQIELNALGSAMVASPDNHYLYILSKMDLTCSISVLDIANMSIKDFPMPPSYGTSVNLQGMCITPDGRRLLATDSDKAGIRVIDTGTLRIVQSISIKNVLYPMGITVLPDASKIFFVGMTSNNLVQIDQIMEQKN